MSNLSQGYYTHPDAARQPGKFSGAAVSGACVVDIAARPSFQMTASEPVAWKSSWKSRLQVDESGLCTAHSLGNVTLTAASASGERASLHLRFVRGVQSIALSGEH